jgi:predicted transposase YbfD/YdcC
MSLINHLKGIKDYRTGPIDYPLWVVLLLVIMAIMSGYTGYSAIETFAKRHQEELLEELGMPCKKMPSDTTIRRILLHVRLDSLSQAFNNWMAERIPDHQGQHLASDGKSIKASVQDYAESYQDFVSLVSCFNVEQGVVVGIAPMRNRTQSELVTFKELLVQLSIEGSCITLDALHAQKKTIEAIVDSNNDYLIAVKGNQPKLHLALLIASLVAIPTSRKQHTETSHGRIVERTITVFDPPPMIDPAWLNLQSGIRVDRSGTRSGKLFSETIFYISSLKNSAGEFAQRIREHWHVENRLHWVKDVVFKEDDTPLCGGSVPAAMGILRTTAVNLFRLNGWDSVTQALRNLAHDIKKLFFFFE